MKDYSKLFIGPLLIIVTAALLSACGDSGTNRPSVLLTSSTVASQTTNGHMHTADIPFIDVSATPASPVFQYRSSDSSGHSHVIALSNAQMSDLNSGMQLTLTSSAPNNNAAPHTHIWNLRSGGVLYDKFCYNCHTNDKRNQSPASNSKMGTSFTFITDQTNALINPGGAPQSTSATATPDPNYMPTASTTPPDGVALYASNCAGCHNPLASTTKANRSAAQIRAAINTYTQMSSLAPLTDVQLQAIATALIK